MDNQDYWKNFGLGTELEITGAFLFNGLKSINTLDNFNYAEDVFELLYNLSVGIERLQKIAIILIENIDVNNKESKKQFEESIRHHKLLNLHIMIECKHSLNLNAHQKEFLHLLSKFYKTYRYDRFNINSSKDYENEKIAFIRFLSNKLSIVNISNTIINTTQTQAYLAKIIKAISLAIYNLIEIEARNLNIYTYALRPQGKAYRIFIYKDFDFKYDTILKKELLIRLVNNSNSSFIKFIKSIKPLPFDVQDENEIIRALMSSNKLVDYFDELDEYYDQLENKKERFEMLDAIGKTGMEFLQ
ncbi:hypothetical protein K8354_06065 [Polaribacter litorisediminis]|uniref:hypothetical protein n=1 Tax=Polaribacter litorisediminis TaxID=1908341 RepID=UPI001CC14F42|nr:hypothetical protein [Polaribacter litorisediminis]UAM99376.1 hypothetical protein K8354_06065 [Polaribacter litorisediminis]